MRTNGSVDSPQGTGAGAHLCWGFSTRGDLKGAVAQFLQEGQSLGQQLMYVAPGPTEYLLEDLEDVPGVDDLIADGALVTAQSRDVYDTAGPIDPRSQLERYTQYVDAALDRGFTGLCVAADSTGLVTDPARWGAHRRWESLTDRYMVDHPVSAICLFDTRVVSPMFMGDLTALHPASGGSAPDSPFRIWSDEGAVMMSGALDGRASSSVERLLTVVLDPVRDRLVDITAVTRLDLRAALGLERFAERLGRRGEGLVLRGADPDQQPLFASPHISFG